MSAHPNLAHDAIPQRRAIGVVRVSQTGGREGERFVSPEEQRDRIEAACARDGLALVAVHEELDVSGGKALADRPGLGAAVAAIEAGDADVIAAAYFDRLFRSLSTQAEVLERVERAGGQVLAVDVGQVGNGSAGQWLSGTMLGAVSEYFRRSAKERSAEGQARAVARGATPWARVPLGYTRRGDGTLEPNREEIPLVVRVFEMRLSGASIPRIREMLKSHGVDRSPRGVQVMLASRVYLGEVHFGTLVNLRAHEPIIERELWTRVQRMVVPRGRQAKSTRLLARLNVLRCGSCGARLVAMKLPKQGDYPIYRCPSTSDCAHHVTISAVKAENAVVEAVRRHIADVEGRASAETNARDAERELDRAQQTLDALIRVLDPLEPASVERLTEATAARDDAREHLDRVGGARQALQIPIAADWDRLTTDEQRAFIRATVDRAVVAPGRGDDRISIHLLGE